MENHPFYLGVHCAEFRNHKITSPCELRLLMNMKPIKYFFTYSTVLQNILAEYQNTIKENRIFKSV